MIWRKGLIIYRAMIDNNLKYSQIRSRFISEFGINLEDMPRSLDGIYKYYRNPAVNAAIWIELIDAEMEAVKENPKGSDISKEAKDAKRKLVILLADLKNREGWDKTLEQVTDEKLKEIAELHDN